jgi:hypothetical protein
MFVPIMSKIKVIALYWKIEILPVKKNIAGNNKCLFRSVAVLLGKKESQNSGRNTVPHIHNNRQNFCAFGPYTQGIMLCVTKHKN